MTFVPANDLRALPAKTRCALRYRLSPGSFSWSGYWVEVFHRWMQRFGKDVVWFSDYGKSRGVGWEAAESAFYRCCRKSPQAGRYLVEHAAPKVLCNGTVFLVWVGGVMREVNGATLDTLCALARSHENLGKLKGARA